MTSQFNIENKASKKHSPLSNKNIHSNNVALGYDDDDLDEETHVNTGASRKVKYLPPSVMKDIEQKNAARKLAGLPPISTSIRRCLTCGSSFQSAGNRTCGCASRVAGIIAGREII